MAIQKNRYTSGTGITWNNQFPHAPAPVQHAIRLVFGIADRGQDSRKCCIGLPEAGIILACTLFLFAGVVDLVPDIRERYGLWLQPCFLDVGEDLGSHEESVEIQYPVLTDAGVPWNTDAFRNETQPPVVDALMLVDGGVKGLLSLI
jgi:hypothetical protein